MVIPTAELEVCSIVDSIVSSFDNGMEIFRRLRRRRSKKQPQHSLSEEDDQLRESLTYRPLEISRQYETNVAKLGKRYEIGDTTSQNRLAHTLLVLNTGLIKLLNHALSDDSRQRSMSPLSELSMRLISASQLALHPSLQDTGRVGRITKNREPISFSKTEVATITRKRPPPTPLLARGGWVRNKSGLSIVSVPVSPTSKPHEHRTRQRARSKSTPMSSDDFQTYKTTKVAYSSDYMSADGSRDMHHYHQQPQHRAWDSFNPRDVSSRSADNGTQERPPSMLVVPSDLFEIYCRPQSSEEKQGRFDEKETISSPPRPPKIPLHSNSNTHTNPRMSPRSTIRARPLSTATFLTTSTKIGEIPEEKLPDRVLSEEEQSRIPMPYIIPPPLEPPRRKGRGFKFWKRPPIDERSAPTVVCH